MRELTDTHGKTIVMVTHDAHAAGAAGRTLHLDKGRLADEEQRPATLSAPTTAQ